MFGELPGDDTENSARRGGGPGRPLPGIDPPARMQIADEAQARYGRKVAWGVTIGDRRILFTHLAVPVMTRLRQPERKVLDTLVDAGVARSRSDALAWTVKLAGQHAEEWLAELRRRCARSTTSDRPARRSDTPSEHDLVQTTRGDVEHEAAQRLRESHERAGLDAAQRLATSRRCRERSADQFGLMPVSSLDVPLEGVVVK